MTTDIFDVLATWGMSQTGHLKIEEFGACGFHLIILIFL